MTEAAEGTMEWAKQILFERGLRNFAIATWRRDGRGWGAQVIRYVMVESPLYDTEDAALRALVAAVEAGGKEP